MLAFKKWMHVPDSHIKVDLPSTQQTKNFSCGPGALRSIAVHFKVGPDSEQYYISKCKANPKKGTNPKDLIRVALELGLKVKSKEGMTLSELQGYLDKNIPVICSVQAWGDKEDYKTNNSGHYIAAIGYSKTRIYFMDPSLKGSRGFMSNKEFMSRWHDEEYGGTHYEQLGIAIWKSSREKETQTLHKIKKIK